MGAYNGLMETQQTVGQWRFPLWSSRPDHGAVAQMPYTVTGPSCDSADTMFYGAALPVTMARATGCTSASAGAYTLSYASHFNGFPPPQTLLPPEWRAWTLPRRTAVGSGPHGRRAGRLASSCRWPGRS